MNKQTIFISLDDTIFNTNDLIAKIWVEALQYEFDVTLSQDYFKCYYAHLNNYIIGQKMNELYDLDIDSEFIKKRINNRFNELFISYAYLNNDSITCLRSLVNAGFKIIAYTKLFTAQTELAFKTYKLGNLINQKMNVGGSGLNANLLKQYCTMHNIRTKSSIVVSQNLNDITYGKLNGLQTIGYTENYYSDIQNEQMTKFSSKTLIALSVLRFVVSLKI